MTQIVEFLYVKGCNISSTVNCHWRNIGETTVLPLLKTVSVYAPLTIDSTATHSFRGSAIEY